jgi:putative ABC transport system permease protein
MNSLKATKVRQLLRVLTKNPGLTIVAVVLLALGIGASTAIFSILWAVAIRPLPYEHPEQLVLLWRTEPVIPFMPASGPDFLDWAKQSDVFSALAAADFYHPTLTGGGGIERLDGFQVTLDIFKVVKAQPAAGRLFAAGDDQPGRDHVVVLGKGFGTRGAGRDLTTIGRTLTLNGEEYEVIGRLPDSFRFPPIMLADYQPDVYVPIPAERLRKDRQEFSFYVIGRLKPGVALRQAQAEMTTIASRLAKQYPESNAGIGVQVASLQEQVRQVAGVLVSLLLFGVGFLLLIGCANIAVILLTQGVRRQREIAIRQALGATPGRVTLQLLAESTLLALAGGVAGVLLAFWFKNALLSLMPAHLIPQTNPITINWQVLAFALLVSVATGVLFGIVPALRLSRVSLEGFLREGAHEGGAGTRSVGARDFLVVCEVTLALSLLITCGLMIRALAGFLLAKPGFNPRNMLTMSITIADSKYPSFEARNGFGRGLLERVNALPGVKSSALEGESIGHIAAADRPLTASAFRQSPFVQLSLVTPDYFRTMQLPLLRGRPFSSSDYLEKPSVAIVNSTLARKLWANQEALGKRFTAAYPPEWCEVVGIAADDHMLFGIDAPKAYVPKLSTQVDLRVRTLGDPKSVMNSVRDAIGHVDKGAGVSSLMTMEESRARAISPIRLFAAILSTMAGVALLLATVGVYVVTAYSVAQRTHEIGVRMALGARRGQVLFFVMRHGTRLSVLGVAIGLLIALALGRILAFFLRGVTLGEVSTYLGVSLLLLVVTLLANFIPARRATRIDPMAALRYE